MKIEQILKSTVDYNDATRTILNIMYTNNVITESFNEIVKNYDISAEQYNVLRILRGQKGSPANMCIIQERMLAKTSNTTRLVDKLLLKELVTRNVCPDNRRKIEVLITEKGLLLLKELEPLLQEHEESFAKNLTAEELQQLNQLIEKYRTK
ncbi:transcriptional regulator, MarR family [Flavobacterium succinicans]|uniref:Transcriptional regulator, MarR family n=1 Tax=Flavobacterium succinicans TaxID=29536 RepID=A0A1I4UP18_9FLAO|nr:MULTISPECIES: MarR family transcriptional regulator [Flavobacterium]OOV29752.1 MarR family transcriptional regulator [Flavobacterium sp. LM5]SFM90722.1 transcriptional regulator, MarR family [Flavobacterium succinicans]